MNEKRLCACILLVCLLPLAGSLALATKISLARSTHPRALSKSLARIPERSTPSRNPGAISIPFAFEPNLGQADSRVAFIGRGRGLIVLLDRREIALQVTP